MEEFIQEYGLYLGAASAFILFFDRLAKLTPTDIDNKVVEYAYKAFAFLGVKVEDVKSYATKEETK